VTDAILSAVQSALVGASVGRIRAVLRTRGIPDQQILAVLLPIIVRQSGRLECEVSAETESGGVAFKAAVVVLLKIPICIVMLPLLSREPATLMRTLSMEHRSKASAV